MFSLIKEEMEVAGKRVLIISDIPISGDLASFSGSRGYEAYYGPVTSSEISREMVDQLGDVDILWMKVSNLSDPVVFEEYKNPGFSSHNMWIVRRDSPSSRRDQPSSPRISPSLPGLPDEILTHLFDYYEPEDIAQLAAINRKFHHLARDTKYWNQRLLREISGAPRISGKYPIERYIEYSSTYGSDEMLTRYADSMGFLLDWDYINDRISTIKPDEFKILLENLPAIIPDYARSHISRTMIFTAMGRYGREDLIPYVESENYGSYYFLGAYEAGSLDGIEWEHFPFSGEALLDAIRQRGDAKLIAAIVEYVPYSTYIHYLADDWIPELVTALVSSHPKSLEVLYQDALDSAHRDETANLLWLSEHFPRSRRENILMVGDNVGDNTEEISKILLPSDMTPEERKILGDRAVESIRMSGTLLPDALDTLAEKGAIFEGIVLSSYDEDLPEETFVWLARHASNAEEYILEMLEEGGHDSRLMKSLMGLLSEESSRRALGPR